MPDPEKHESLKTYRDLVVWQKAMDLVVESYKLARKLPRDERFGLTAQIRDASSSIPANIAEGYGRRRRGEYLHFLGIANGSLMELETHIIARGRLEYFNRDEATPAWNLAQEVGRLLNKLMASLEPPDEP